MFRIPFLVIALVGCADESSNAIEKPCTPNQSSPYSNGIPYLGIHADAGNSDVIPCESASNFAQTWHALEGLGLTQPNTFSPDGATLYATTTNPLPCDSPAVRYRSTEGALT